MSPVHTKKIELKMEENIIMRVRNFRSILDWNQVWNREFQNILNKCHELFWNKFYWLESDFLWFDLIWIFEWRMQQFIFLFCLFWFVSLFSLQQKSTIMLISHLPWYRFSFHLYLDGTVLIVLYCSLQGFEKSSYSESVGSEIWNSVWNYSTKT